MKNGFQLARVPRITQAPGALERVGVTAAALDKPGSGVLLVADPALKSPGFVETAERALREVGMRVTLFDRVESDPKVATADEAAALARSVDATTVVALGGGSVIDVGKAVAVIAPATKSAAHYALCANPFPPNPLNIICIPSTSGTGAETTRTSILSDANGTKLWLWGDELKADDVILDPVIVTGLPAHLTAATGIDALVHAIEASTNANAYPASNMYCFEAIRLVTRHLSTAVRHPEDLTARAGLQLAAALAGIGVDNCGTAIAHNIGHALASLRPVHHGRAVGLAMLATLAWNVAEDDDGSFAAVAHAMGVAGGVEALPNGFERLLRNAGVKVSLAGEGYDTITPEQLAAQMCRPENESMRKSNRRVASNSDLLHFAQTILTQV